MSGPVAIRRRQSAFTFLELMLAVTLLGLVMTAIFSTWSAALNGWKRMSSVSDNFQRERIVMSTLADLTKSLVYVNNKDNLYDVTYKQNSQTGGMISFVTASNALLPPSEVTASGMRRVILGLQLDQRGRPYLGLANAPALGGSAEDEEPVLQRLSPDVCGFAVRFRHPRDGTMKDQWDEPNLVPSAIEYTVAFGANDGRTPPVVVTRAIELPVAAYALQLLGQSLSQQNTTNSVTKRETELVGGGGSDKGDDSE